MKSVTVAVLFARTDSNYKNLSGVDVYDKCRDARTFSGTYPVIAHPPCRSWGRLHAFAKPEPGERELAFFAVEQVRRNGGVLEHPAHSKLWQAAGLPEPGQRDRWGGFTLDVLQFWWGHRAEKRTWLYVCGIEPDDLPQIPFVFGFAPCVVTTSRKDHGYKRPEITKAEREHTPPSFARWLVNVARRIGGAARAANDNEPPTQRTKGDANA